MKMRLNITLSDDLVKKVDEKAQAMYISRSAFIATALVQKLQADEAMEMLPKLSQTLQAAMNEAEKRKNIGQAIKSLEERAEP